MGRASVVVSGRQAAGERTYTDDWGHDCLQRWTHCTAPSPDFRTDFRVSIWFVLFASDFFRAGYTTEFLNMEQVFISWLLLPTISKVSSKVSKRKVPTIRYYSVSSMTIILSPTWTPMSLQLVNPKNQNYSLRLWLKILISEQDNLTNFCNLVKFCTKSLIYKR